MPTISSFYGIIIIMHLREKEHNPPHIHAVTQECTAAFDIRTAQKMNDDAFPLKATAMVKEFIIKNREELLRMWETGEYKKLDPIE
jgi:hypothetical protein